VPAFFEAADTIAHDLATKPIGADELQRVTEPLLQYINRVSTGNLFWLYQIEGSTQDPRRILMLRSLLPDLTQTTPEKMQALAQKYLGKPGWRLAVIPKGQQLATKVSPTPSAAGR
jgi:zinc protease